MCTRARVPRTVCTIALSCSVPLNWLINIISRFISRDDRAARVFYTQQSLGTVEKPVEFRVFIGRGAQSICDVDAACISTQTSSHSLAHSSHLWKINDYFSLMCNFVCSSLLVLQHVDRFYYQNNNKRDRRTNRRGRTKRKKWYTLIERIFQFRSRQKNVFFWEDLDFHRLGIDKKEVATTRTRRRSITYE